MKKKEVKPLSKAARRKILIAKLTDIKLNNFDAESAHVEADDALLDFIADDEVRKIYDSMELYATFFGDNLIQHSSLNLTL